MRFFFIEMLKTGRVTWAKKKSQQGDHDDP